MKDMTKASNPFYLAFFLLVVCGVSTLVMAYTAVKTEEPIRISQAKETADSLKLILPAFDNDPAADAIDLTSPDGEPVKLYTAKNGGLVVGYAAEASASGFGGKVAGIVSFKADGTVDTVIVKSGHSETPRHRHQGHRPHRAPHHHRRRQRPQARSVETPRQRGAGFLFRHEARCRQVDQG